MTGRLAHIYRHPIKAHGREALASVLLSAGECLAWDRRWAVAHEAATIAPGWNNCNSFLRGVKSPQLMAMEARFDEGNQTVHLSHPLIGTLAVNPDLDADAARLIDWVRPLIPDGRAQPVKVVRFDGGMTDNPLPVVSILSLSSLADLSGRMGMDLSIHRWRANFWIDGPEPWAEFDWIGKQLTLGETVLEVTERIGRCRATCVNPATGEVEGETLAALSSAFGHTDFGIFAKVVRGGKVALGDKWSLI